MNQLLNRREFNKSIGLITSGSIVMPSLLLSCPDKKEKRNVTLSTDFISGGGEVKLIKSNPLTLLVTPHNQNNGGWSQVWWYFLANHVTPGEELTILLELSPPKISGINPKIKFSYDQKDWGLTDTGSSQTIDGKEYFVYKHIVRGNKVWFAYDIPFHNKHVESLLIPKTRVIKNVEVIELCRSKGNNPVHAFVFNSTNSRQRKFGIWLQARAHAFESGSSWVLYGLTKWLMSDCIEAKALRECSLITVVPIVDVDGVIEGRTGKMQYPYDHNRGWSEDPGVWPEVQAIKSKLNELTRDNILDLFIDFHGPGNQRHPYFIIPEEGDLFHSKQRKNRKQFFNVLKATPFDEHLNQTQSMTQFCYSARPKEKLSDGDSCSWVRKNGPENNISLTLEVNMNTPLSTLEGYFSEGESLGRAISKYFVGNYHEK